MSTPVSCTDGPTHIKPLARVLPLFAERDAHDGVLRVYSRVNDAARRDQYASSPLFSRPL
jgi:hypothetical protein